MFFNGFPGGFPGMGGFAEGEEGPNDDEGGSTNNTKYYEVIGVEKSASQQEITKAYRKKALQLHPDKHPDEKEKYQVLFQELQEAYEVLNDPDKRKLYDRYGEAGLKGSSQSDMGGLFDVIFGGRGGGGGGRGRRPSDGHKKAPPIKLPLDVGLEDLFLGATKTHDYKRYILCKKCEGKGGSKVIECTACNGQGIVIQIQRMGHMTLQQQRACSKCEGEGTITKDSDKCKECEGKGVKEQTETLEIQIPVGSKHADQVVIRGRGHEIPQQANGDVVIMIRCSKHPLFTRVGADLMMNYTLSLKEALCGFDIQIRHLSGKKLRLKSKSGETIQPDETKVIYGQGMPQKGNTQVKGHLYILFKIKFPPSGNLTETALKEIRGILPQEKKEEKDNDVDMKQEKKKKTPKEPKPPKDETNPAENKEKVDGAPEEEEEEDEEPIEVHVDAEAIEGEPEVTPASSKSAYDEDEEEQQGVQCRHM